MPELVTAYAEQVQVLSTMNVGQMWDRLLGEFLGEWTRLERQQLPAAEFDRQLGAFMDELSEKPLADLGRKSTTVAYNQGRDVEIRTEEQIEFVVRSEVLDNSTCRVCQLLDNEVFRVGTSEYIANMPPAQCLGGDRCRGFYIPVSAEVALPAVVNA